MDKNQIYKIESAIQFEEEAWHQFHDVYLGFSGNPSERQRKELGELFGIATRLSVKVRELLREVIKMDEERDLTSLENLLLTDPDTGDRMIICSNLDNDGNGMSSFNVMNPHTRSMYRHIVKTTEANPGAKAGLPLVMHIS